MIVHNLDPVLINFGFFQIKWYSIAYIFAIIFGWMYGNFIIKNKKALISIKTQDFDDLILYLIFGIILGGRLGYVFFYNFEYYIANPSQIYKVWLGGMSFHGGLLGVIISTFVYSKISKKKFFELSDIICCVAPIGLFLGRIANFINGELYGKISTAPWAIIFPNADKIPRHPSQIYEALLEGIVLFSIINFFAIKKNIIIKTGYISCLFLISYSVLRIFSEIFREPDKHLGYLYNYISMGILLSIIMFVSGCLILFLLKKNEQNN